MFRLLFAGLMLVAVAAQAAAQNHRYHRGYRQHSVHPNYDARPAYNGHPIHSGHPIHGGYRSPGTWEQQLPWGYPRGTTGYRFGYLYDPYASGSFRAPDLMDDPSFRAKQRVGRLFYSEPAPQLHIQPRYHSIHP